MAERLRKRSRAIVASLIMTMVWPMIVTEEIGPYFFLCSNQWWHSSTPGLGMSLTFPRIGSPLGPGGRGRTDLFSQSFVRMCRTVMAKRKTAMDTRRTMVSIILLYKGVWQLVEKGVERFYCTVHIPPSRNIHLGGQKQRQIRQGV